MTNRNRGTVATAFISFIIYAACAAWVLPDNPREFEKGYCVLFGFFCVGIPTLIYHIETDE